MNNWIRSHLVENSDATLLFAVENGSRAWGMESQDSDYDIRYIYYYDTSRYLSVFNSPAESRSEFLQVKDKQIDLVGWDIYKFLRLLGKSNPATMEWLRSPICYINHPVREKLLEISSKFSRFTLFMHYNSMALGNYRKYIEDNTKPSIKKQLYVIRSLLNAIYIDVKFNFPPLQLLDCLRSLSKEKQWGLKTVTAGIKEMVELKRDMKEEIAFQASSDVKFWITETLDQLDSRKEDIKKRDNFSINKSDLEQVLVGLFELN